jgi:hypothetical protein
MHSRTKMTKIDVVSAILAILGAVLLALGIYFDEPKDDAVRVESTLEEGW